MPDIRNTIKATKITWIKRLTAEDNQYTILASENAKIDNFKEFFNSKLNSKSLEYNPAEFYKQIIDYWYELRKIDNLNTNEILNEDL